MQAQAGSLECRVCRNQLVAGVACDGQYENCPHRVRQAGTKVKTSSQVYAQVMSDLAQPGEFDAIRSDS
jgi:hypothetical protein